MVEQRPRRLRRAAFLVPLVLGLSSGIIAATGFEQPQTTQVEVSEVSWAVGSVGMLAATGLRLATYQRQQSPAETNELQQDQQAEPPESTKA